MQYDQAAYRIVTSAYSELKRALRHHHVMCLPDDVLDDLIRELRTHVRHQEACEREKYERMHEIGRNEEETIQRAAFAISPEPEAEPLPKDLQDELDDIFA